MHRTLDCNNLKEGWQSWSRQEWGRGSKKCVVLLLCDEWFAVELAPPQYEHVYVLCHIMSENLQTMQWHNYCITT